MKGVSTDRYTPQLPVFDNRAISDRPALYDPSLGVSFKPMDQKYPAPNKENIYTDPKLL